VSTTSSGASSLKIEDLAYQCGGDLCLSFWALAYEKGWIEFPPNAAVLEIGCAEADWQTPMLAARPDLNIVGIDWRECKRPGVVARGDVLTWQSPSLFDAVVSISAIEHIGLGGYENAPEDAEGDIKTMQRVHEWLRPGGWCYLDVPFQEHGPLLVQDGYRRYNAQAIEDRLCQGLFAIEQQAKCLAEHPDSPYMALLLRRK